MLNSAVKNSLASFSIAAWLLSALPSTLAAADDAPLLERVVGGASPVVLKPLDDAAASQTKRLEGCVQGAGREPFRDNFIVGHALPERDAIANNVMMPGFMGEAAFGQQSPTTCNGMAEKEVSTSYLLPHPPMAANRDHVTRVAANAWFMSQPTGREHECLMKC